MVIVVVLEHQNRYRLAKLVNMWVPFFVQQTT